VVTLDDGNAEETASHVNNRPQLCYWCNDGAVKLYLDLEHEQPYFDQLQPHAGDTVSIRKVKRGKNYVLECKRVSDAAEEPAPRLPAALPLEERLARESSLNRVAKHEAAVTARKNAIATANGHNGRESKPNGYGHNGNGNSNGTTHASGENPTAQHLKQCFHIAIDVLKDAAQYGRDQEFSATFLGSDVKSLALSIYINDQEKKR
jgi:hypothetical protein